MANLCVDSLLLTTQAAVLSGSTIAAGTELGGVGSWCRTVPNDDYSTFPSDLVPTDTFKVYAIRHKRQAICPLESIPHP